MTYLIEKQTQGYSWHQSIPDIGIGDWYWQKRSALNNSAITSVEKYHLEEALLKQLGDLTFAKRNSH
ncbi:unnamed protein product [Gordionus sp. m RMFG-2023]